MKPRLKKIIFIVCFFGEPAWYFKFFLKSAGCNPLIDFLFVTDIPDHSIFPSNFRVLPMRLKDLEELAKGKLGCDVSLNFPYKVCDIRPAYGVIFEDYLKDYDFWGYCDADVIFGDIRSFLTNRILNKFDIISARPDFLPGYFVLYKNCENVNELFKKSKDYIEVFGNPKYMNFDECGSKHVDLVDGKRIQELDNKIESMTYLLKWKCADDVKTRFDLMAIDFAIGKIYWDNGLLTYDDKFQVLLYHLIDYKRTTTCIVPDWLEVPDRFYIHESNFSYSGLSA